MALPAGTSSFLVTGDSGTPRIVSTLAGWDRLVQAASADVRSWHIEERGRPFVYDQVVDLRADFDATVAFQKQRTPLCEVEEILSHWLRAELTRICAHPTETEPEAGWPCVGTSV